MGKTATTGARMRDLRLARGLSQEQAARGIGVAHVTYGKWERDEVVPGTDNLVAAAKFFGIDPAELGYEVPTEYTPQAPPWFAADQERRIAHETRQWSAMKLLLEQAGVPGAKIRELEQS